MKSFIVETPKGNPSLFLVLYKVQVERNSSQEFYPAGRTWRCSGLLTLLHVTRVDYKVTSGLHSVHLISSSTLSSMTQSMTAFIRTENNGVK